jgi:hypothetical protein
MYRQLSRGNALAIELVSDDSVSRWHELMGPSNPADARAAAPDSLRAQYCTGSSPDANGFYGSASNDTATAELTAVFNGSVQLAATYRDCTLYDAAFKFECDVLFAAHQSACGCLPS